jgi:mannose-1-phosphate guanylyltransferase
VTNRINAGFYVFARHVIDAIPEGRPVSVERETFPQLLEEHATVLGFVDNSYWLDVGTPAAFVRGSSDVVRGVVESPALVALAGRTGESMVHVDANVHAGAVVSGGSMVGPRSQIDDGAQIIGSVIADGVHIGAGAVVERSLVGRRSDIGAGATLVDAVIGEGARVGADNELANGIRVWTDAVIPDASIRFTPLP